jgi:sugar/nucleoside kinase (ribokinase family)
MSQPAYDVLTFGDLCVDLIITGEDVVPQFGQVEKLVDDYLLEMGGSCSIFACQAARLGLKVAILGRVGPDQFGELILHRLRQAGVDTRFVQVDPALKTGLGIALCKENDRAIMTYLGSLSANRPEDVSDELLSAARHLHHGSYYLHTQLRPAIPDIFRRARRLGLSISLDTNWDPEERWGEGLAEVLPLVDVFLPNEQEALRISGADGLEQAVSSLHALNIPLVAVKRGEQGAMASDGHKLVRCGVEPVSGGDSIGAGDSFDAGFLSGWLRGLSLDECLKIGCLCGRGAASQLGGVRGHPTWEQVQSSLNS